MENFPMVYTTDTKDKILKMNALVKKKKLHVKTEFYLYAESKSKGGKYHEYKTKGK